MSQDINNRKESKRTQRYRVFLSYASGDKDVAQKIVNKLRQGGVQVFYSYELKWGDSLFDAIQNAISASDYLIVLLSPNSVNSVWVQNELNWALARELTTRDITLLPIVIADCEIPAALASRKYLDLRFDFDRGLVSQQLNFGMIL